MAKTKKNKISLENESKKPLKTVSVSTSIVKKKKTASGINKNVQLGKKHIMKGNEKINKPQVKKLKKNKKLLAHKDDDNSTENLQKVKQNNLEVIPEKPLPASDVVFHINFLLKDPQKTKNENPIKLEEDEDEDEDEPLKTEKNKNKIKSEHKKTDSLKKVNKKQKEDSPKNDDEDETGTESEGENIKSKKQKVGKNDKNKISLQDVPPFNEETFNSIINENNISSVVKLLKQQVSEEVSKKKNQIFSDYKYMLNVVCFKIPLCPKRLVKLKLKHSLISENDDVCLIVKDLQRGRKFDFEPTIHFYEDLFQEKGITGIKTIIPFNQLKKEYGSYEMKIKLSNLYDYFLCDGAIVGHVFGFLGKKSRCTLHAVRMNTPDTAREIRKTLCKTSYKQGQKGTMISIPIGRHDMTVEQITDNILTIIKQLKNVYAGGLPNIRSIYLKINMKSTSSLPLYISMAAPPEQTPFVVGPKEQKLKELRQKANNILSKFNMSTLGSLIPSDSKTGSKKRQNENQMEKQPQSKKKKLKNKSKKIAGDTGVIEENPKKSKMKKGKQQSKKKSVEELDEEETEDSENDIVENNQLKRGKQLNSEDNESEDHESDDLDEDDESDDLDDDESDDLDEDEDNKSEDEDTELEQDEDSDDSD